MHASNIMCIPYSVNAPVEMCAGISRLSANYFLFSFFLLVATVDYG